MIAATTAAAFLPRGITLNAQDQFQLSAPSALGGLLVALPAAGLCLGLWWLLSCDYYLPLAVSSAGLLVAALFLPRGLPVFFVPAPLVLLGTAWVLRWSPPDRTPGGTGRPKG